MTVEWQDAATHYGWQDLGRERPPMIVQTRGFLVRRGRNGDLEVAQNLQVATEQCSEVITIPAGLVRRLRFET